VSVARVLVAGAGPVGMALACALRGCEVRVFDAAAAPRPRQDDAFELRIYALGAGTRAFLRELGVWERMDAARIAPVRRMEVFGDAGARLDFPGRAGLPLAWIVEAGELGRALHAQAATLPSVRVSHGARAIGFEAAASGVRMRLEDGAQVEGDLLVGADGPQSAVRTLLGLGAEERDYGEEALVANFETGSEHGGVARQWFRHDGVLAWLPLPGRRISIVWSAPLEHAQALAALDAEAFAARVRDAGQAALGELRLASGVGRFALRWLRARQATAPGVALVGDAAHGVHPLAGQGVNLGFQDARVLAAALAQRSPLERVGDERVLRRYARARSEDVAAMQLVTDGLDRLFASRAPGAARVRNAGLGLVDSLSWAKSALAARAMR
jgi:2-octaprenylphenol hydroxylase